METVLGGTQGHELADSYDPPTLVDLGTLQDLTQGAGGLPPDCAALGTADGATEVDVCSQ